MHNNSYYNIGLGVFLTNTNKKTNYHTSESLDKYLLLLLLCLQTLLIQNIFAKQLNEANSFNYSNFPNLNRKAIL